MQITGTRKEDIIIQTESSTTNQDQDGLFQASKFLLPILMILFATQSSMAHAADFVVLAMVDMVDGH